MMSDDPTRATPLPGGTERYGRLGPMDPNEDPATHPGLRPPGPSEITDPGLEPVRDAPTVPAEAPTVPTADPEAADPAGAGPDAAGPGEPVVPRSRTGGLHAGLILSAIVLVFLLVFIVQNLERVTINFLGFAGSLPVGVALLLAAVGGLLLVAIPGGLRILQLRRAARRAAGR